MTENRNSQKEKKTYDKKKCFIIMPITTPESLITEYSGGSEHFRHVLEEIFIPAIEKANLDPIPPKVKGSGLIQADIIKNLETADLILCDMSTLNPNVFFEFGIRTSLNKPVSLVVDDKTLKIPFDPSIIHYQRYNSALHNWTLKEDVNSLSDHIKDSISKSAGKNALWKYFGLSSIAYPAEIREDEETQWSYLILQINSLKDKIESLNNKIGIQEYEEKPRSITDDIIPSYYHLISPKVSQIFSQRDTNIIRNLINVNMKKFGILHYDVSRNIARGYDLIIREKISEKIRRKLIALFKGSGINLNIIEKSSS